MFGVILISALRLVFTLGVWTASVIWYGWNCLVYARFGCGGGKNFFWWWASL